jgi:hypothetical protein
MISQLQTRARISGNFADRAILREIKMAFARLAGTPAVTEVVRLAEGWEAGAPDLQVLDAIRRINRSASCRNGDARPVGS